MGDAEGCAVGALKLWEQQRATLQAVEDTLIPRSKPARSLLDMTRQKVSRFVGVQEASTLFWKRAVPLHLFAWQ